MNEWMEGRINEQNKEHQLQIQLLNEPTIHVN